MGDIKDYAIGDTFKYEGEPQEVCGFGVVDGKNVLFATNVEYGPPSMIDEFGAYEAGDLPPNLASRTVLQKMTKAELIDLVLGDK
jgi:hypothetical protein